MKLAFVDNLFGFNTKVFDHNLLNPLANLTHRSTSCLFPQGPDPRDITSRRGQFFAYEL